MADSDKQLKRVFISYSHQDEIWKERLHTQLKVLERQGLLTVWEDRQIPAGEDWYPAIEQALNSAQVAILLISADFLSSNFILGEEVPRLLKRRQTEGLRIIPLIIRHCAWNTVPWLASIQGRPKDNQPLSGFNDNQQEQCLADLTQEINELLRQEKRELQNQLAEYKRYLVETYKYLDFKGIDSIAEAVKGSSGITLEAVYVPLRARLDTPDAETWHRLGGRLYRGAKVVADAEPEKLEQEISRAEQAALTVEQWMQQQPALVILGDPGSGKSTTLKRLALGLAQQENGPLPILIPLNAYSKALDQASISFEEFLPEYFHGKRAQLDRHKLRMLFTDALQQRTAVVLLDGLDEVGLNRGPLVEQVQSFVRAWVPERPVRMGKDKATYEFALQQSQHSGNRMVATSRFVGYRDYPLTDPRWQTVALNDWNRKEIDRFFTGFTLACELAWKGGENQEDAQTQAETERRSLLRVIDANPGIRRLAGNPLLASLLALIKRQGVTLPDRRVELYKLYMETLLRSWNRARSLDKQPIGPEIDFSPTQRLLAKLALHLRQTNPQGGLIEEMAMRDYLRDYFLSDGYTRKEADEQTKGFLDSVHKYSNLLIEKGHQQYGFIHLTFEEYLAGFGLALLREPELQTLFPAYLQQPEQWRETLLLSIGVMAVINTNPEKAEPILENLLATTEYKAVLFAGAALNDVGANVVSNRMARKIQHSLLSLGQDINQTLSIRRCAGLLLGDSSWLPEDLDRLKPIRKGRFLYGENKTQTEIPHDYWIGKYPVTNAQYKRFIDAGGYKNKAYWTDQGWQMRLKDHWQQPGFWEDSDRANPLSPVVGVSWHEAQAYCCWLQTQLSAQAVAMGLIEGFPENYSVRLPTNEEWERAARGVDGRKYPWGKDFKSNYANCRDAWEVSAEDKGTTAVGLFFQGESPAGLLDAAGNVWEWTLDQDGDHYISGGSWDGHTVDLRCAIRIRYHPDGRYDNLGFRLVLGYP